MKKNKILSSILAAVIVSALFICVKTEAVETIYKTITAVVEFPASVIKHTPITNVSENSRYFNAKINVDFGCYTAADAKILYYLNGSSSTIKEKIKNSIPNKQDFFIDLPQFSEADTSVDYQIEVTFKIRDEEMKMFYPVDAENNPYYIHAVIASSSTVVINGNTGGTIEVGTGDQSQGTSSVEVTPGSYDGNHEVTFEELDPSLFGFSAPRLAPSKAALKVMGTSPVKAYGYAVDGNYDLALSSPSVVTIAYDGMKSGDNFILRRRPAVTSSADNDEDIEIAKVDYANKKVVANVNKTGYYLLFLATEHATKDFRPTRRVIVKARIDQNAGGGFWFKYLTEGDSVKIYNVNGKKVRTITSGSADGFVWDCKNDSGQYVESGTYIYQIKVKDRSKVISGTIAFVK